MSQAAYNSRINCLLGQPSIMQLFPKVFISIVNWNKQDDTMECLESVLKMDYRNYTVIVVDNASNDSSPCIIRAKYSDVIVIENEQNLGFTGGHNIGMRYAIEHGANYVWILNNDATVEVDTLSALIDAAEKDSSIGLVSPQINYYQYPAKVQFRGSYFEWNTFEEVYPSEDSDEVDSKFQSGIDVTLWGTALLIKRSVIEKIGYLDERLFAYSEDLDYSIRALNANFRSVLFAGARIFHKNDLSWMNDRPPYYFYYISRNWYLLRSAYLHGWRRINMQRRYLARILDRISFIVRYHNSHKEYLDAIINGAWHGVLHVGGRMSSSPKVPYIVEKMLVFLGSHPPFFWAHLIEGRAGLILEKMISKIKTSRTI